MVLLATLLSCLLPLAFARPQGPNTLAPYNPNLRTESYNGTYFILAIPKSTVAALVPYPLLAVPSDSSLFPTPFPADSHPVIVNSGYMNDIRMSALQIASLLGAAIAVPYVDRLSDGNTPFLYPLMNWVGGTNGQDIMSLIPSIVGTFEGVTITPASIVPNNAAYLAITPDEYTVQVKTIVVPNPVSGPGVIIENVDLDFVADPTPNTVYTAHTFHALINQAEVLNNGMCQRNTYYFNQSFTDGMFRKGNVTLYNAPADPNGLARVYTFQSGYSASAISVGFNAQDCKSAAASVDQSALQ